VWSKWTHLDLFSGIGGFSLAAAWTGRIKTVQFVEIDPFCRRVLAKHWPGVAQHDDIKTFLADPAGDRGSGIDLLTAGFPCQPFSAAGKRKGAGDDRYLWPELARVVAAVRPRWCLFENVTGIINVAGGLSRVYADMEELGYDVGSVVIPAAAVAAPHKRDRVWILAHADEPGCTQHGRSIAEFAQLSPAQHAGGNGALRHGAQPALGVSPDGLPRGLDGRPTFGPDWEDGVARVTQRGTPDRVAQLKGLGNAIVPQVAYEILLAMLEADA